MSNSPSFEDKIYKSRIENWAKMDAFKEGLDAVKPYLMKWERESNEGFKARQKSATLFNVVNKTVQTSNGLIFRKEISYTDLNPVFEQRIEDIDNRDANLNEFAKDVSQSALWKGLSYILVDMPYTEVIPETRQQQNDLGLIPYFTKIEADQVINRRIDGDQLTQMTIKEVVTEYTGEFGEDEITQYRVLYIGGGKIYRGDTVFREWTTGLDYIPIVPVYSNKKGYFDGASKFIEIANLNLKHFNLQSQLDKTLFIASNPIAKIWGNIADDAKEMTVGVDKALTWSSKDDGDFQWEEFKGTTVDKLQDELERTEQRMATLGLSMLVKQQKDITATEKIIDSAGENSDLSSIADSVEWALNTAYAYFCDMMKTPLMGEITVNDDFTGVGLSPDQAKVYLEMYNSGVLDLERLWDELQRKEFIADFDREEVKANIEATNQIMDLGGTPIPKN